MLMIGIFGMWERNNMYILNIMVRNDENPLYYIQVNFAQSRLKAKGFNFRNQYSRLYYYKTIMQEKKEKKTSP